MGPINNTCDLRDLPESGELRSSQMDIDLPGFAGVNLTREFSSTSASFGMFGSGWRCNLIANLVHTDGDISINFGDHVEIFLQADGYANRDRTMKLSFPDLNTIIAEDRAHNRWTFDVPSHVCQSYQDANGRVTTFNTTVQDKLIDVIGGSNVFERVYLLNDVTFADGRNINFNYSVGRCSKATSPSGFTVDYSYTDGLLTGIAKSNGQTLSYNYFTTNNGTVTRGWLRKIAYYNGGQVEL